MPKKNHSPEEIITKLREVEIYCKKQEKGRFWDNNGSCIRLCPEHMNHVWTYDFVSGRLSNG